MLPFEDLNVNDEIKSVLLRYDVDFVFQPIFDRLGDILGYEALMRPVGYDILDYIRLMESQDKLHELELVSFFGATLAYRLRKYDKKLSINSFPSECFTVKEAKAYSDCFKPIKDKLVIEILEYTEGENWKWKTKEAHTKVYEGIQISLDDFGSGHNNRNAVLYYNPQYIKLDRSLISNIDKDIYKQSLVIEHIKEFHSKNISVLAEGVETEEEYTFLYNHGIDYFQGFYLARPA